MQIKMIMRPFQIHQTGKNKSDNIQCWSVDENRSSYTLQVGDINSSNQQVATLVAQALPPEWSAKVVMTVISTLRFKRGLRCKVPSSLFPIVTSSCCLRPKALRQPWLTSSHTPHLTISKLSTLTSNRIQLLLTSIVLTQIQANHLSPEWRWQFYSVGASAHNLGLLSTWEPGSSLLGPKSDHVTSLPKTIYWLPISLGKRVLT